MRQVSRRKFVKSAGLFVPAVFGIIVPRARGQGYYYAAASAGGGGGCTTLFLENNTTAANNTFGAARRIFGQGQWNDGGVSRTICKLGFLLLGNGTGFDFECRIYTQTGINLNALQATSNTITGANWAVDTWVEGEFASPFATGGTSTNYALTIRPTVQMSGNDITGYNGGTAINGYREMWSDAGAADQGGGNDVAFRIYTP